MSDKLTYEEIDQIEYFRIEKGDIKRWTEWDEIRPRVLKQYPEIIAAMMNLDLAEVLFSAVISKAKEGARYE